MSFIKELNSSLQGQRSTVLYQSTKAGFHKLSLLIHSTCTQLQLYLSAVTKYVPSLTHHPWWEQQQQQQMRGCRETVAFSWSLSQAYSVSSAATETQGKNDTNAEISMAT